ncbi:NAD-dependent protein deacetylase [Nocardioides perillae]|uniref:protein acetyllysine N-acetyltransferase n=1 Tax=Nocardioides perillae TaxID=1119534 RepID=A0A7Y9UVG0_9ACTN|nr:NAD-dependent protein deacetylase [Nocardioides perillae]NYG57000.1 NAD-dependent SIR2 family protein deacetylase [Nocardioides perillae]
MTQQAAHAAGSTAAALAPVVHPVVRPAQRPALPPRTHHDDPAAALALLADRRLVVLTGAGLSTDSGIPDYRGPGAPVRTPMTYQEFVAAPRARQRYWARSHVGWGRMRHAEPNAGHLALARLDPELLVTQNVDGLHERAGSRRVVALHGRIADVVCLDCRRTTSRAALHARLTTLNPGYAEAHADVADRPDGDVELEETADFVVPGCEACGGVLKPDVVFFGENVPRPRVQRCLDAVDALADDPPGALLVVGSSLTVMSGLRFVRRAAKAGTPVVVVNRGATRGDDLATLVVEAGCSGFLTALADARG